MWRVLVVSLTCYIFFIRAHNNNINIAAADGWLYTYPIKNLGEKREKINGTKIQIINAKGINLAIYDTKKNRQRTRNKRMMKKNEFVSCEYKKYFK